VNILEEWCSADPERKTIIFCGSVDVLKALQIYLSSKDFNCVPFAGSSNDKETALSDFKSTLPGSPTVILMSILSGGGM
jgi:SNF2 family DNA or RNA helicase